MLFKMLKKLLEGFIKNRLEKSSIKEGEQEVLPFSQASYFEVHNPKWYLPLLLTGLAFFAAISFYSYKKSFPYVAAITAAVSVLILACIIFTKDFSIKVEGAQFTVTKFLSSQTFFPRDITSVLIDNANNMSINVNGKKIQISGMSVNSQRFYTFAEDALYQNLETQHITYTVIRSPKETVLMSIALFITAFVLGTAVIYWKEFSKQELIAAYTVFGGITAAAFFYFPTIISRKISVDEKAQTITYFKGLKKYSAGFDQILSLDSKKRTGERNAFNYTIIIKSPDGKLCKKKFTSLDKNADRFTLRLYKNHKSSQVQDEEY